MSDIVGYGIYFVSCIIFTVFFFKLAISWKGLMSKWTDIDMIFIQEKYKTKRSEKMAKVIRLTAAVFMGFGIGM